MRQFRLKVYTSSLPSVVKKSFVGRVLAMSSDTLCRSAMVVKEIVPGITCLDTLL